MLSRSLLCLGLVALLATAAGAANRPATPETAASPDGWTCPNMGPLAIVYPEFGKPGVQKDYTLKLPNCGVNPITVHNFVPVEDYIFPTYLPSGWLGYVGPTGAILPGDSLLGTIQVNKGGIINSGPSSLIGRLLIIYTDGALPLDTVYVRIEFIVADTIVNPRWDTLSTACTDLVMSSDGNIGHTGMWSNGRVNMDYAGSALECDTGSNSRGDGDIYLYDGSPVIVRKTGASSYRASWSVFDDGWASGYEFKPLMGFAPAGKITTNPKWDLYNTGTFCTSDSLVKVEKTIYAPKGMPDSCKFFLQKTMFFPYTIGQSVSNLAIGEIVDWDVPSDDHGFWNVAGADASRRLLWVRGVNKADDTVDCRDNSVRYAGMGLLYVHNRLCGGDSSLYGAYSAASDVFAYPEGTLVPSQTWDNMQPPGYSLETRTTDLHSMLVYKNAAGTGYTLAANDTLTVWSVLITIPDAATTQAGLDSLKAQYDRARRFFRNTEGLFDYCYDPCSCCKGTRGNINGVSLIDLSDLSLLIAYLTAPVKPTLPCFCSADINDDGVVDLRDLAWMIAYLTVTPRPTLPPC